MTLKHQSKKILDELHQAIEPVLITERGKPSTWLVDMGHFGQVVLYMSKCIPFNPNNIPSILILLLFATALVNCNANKQNPDKLHYDSLQLLELTKEVEITETKDFIAVYLNGFFVAEDGHLLLAERTPPSLHQFTPDGSYSRQVARDGRGPGELTSGFQSTLRGNALITSNNPGHMTTIFKQEENGDFHFSESLNYEYPGSFRGFRSSDNYNLFYVSENAGLQTFAAPDEFTTARIHAVEVINDSMSVKESIYSLAVHSAYMDISENSISIYTLPYRYTDPFKPLDDGRALTARADSQIVRILDKDFKIEHEIHLNVANRDVTTEDLDFHIGQIDNPVQQKMRELIKDSKPAFMDIQLDDSNRFWLWTDDSGSGREYVVLDYFGDPLGKVLLPQHQQIEMVKGNRLYVLNRPHDDAHTAVVYHVDIE